jgi:hypothetical protein
MLTNRSTSAAVSPLDTTGDTPIRGAEAGLGSEGPQGGRARLTGWPTSVGSRRFFLAIPLLVLFLTSCCWFGALVKSGFLADDFLNLVTYSNFSHFFSIQYDDGQFPVNVFWTVGYISFGTGSAIPYLLVDTTVFVSGLFLWLRAGTARRWAAPQGWWIAAFVLASAAWMLIALWSSNVSHSIALLALGAAMLVQERAVDSTRCRRLLFWSLAEALAFTLMVASDPLYIGVLPLAVYCTVEQVSVLRSLGVDRRLHGLLSWSVLLPLLYFFLISYRVKNSDAAYAGSNIEYLARDWAFYVAQMAPTRLIKAAYLTVFLATGVGSVWALRYRQFFAVACCLSVGLMGGIILSERQQLFTNYTVVPSLLILSACVAGWTTVFRSGGFGIVRRCWWVPPLAATVLVAILFYSGGAIRAYFEATPYGTERGLVQLRDSVATLSPPGEPLCVVETMGSSDEVEFNAWIANGDAFLVDPVDAAYTSVVSAPSDCLAGVPTIVDVGVARNGDFEITGHQGAGS